MSNSNIGKKEQPVYKVNYLVNNEIQKIIVFNGVKSKKKDRFMKKKLREKQGKFIEYLFFIQNNKFIMMILSVQLNLKCLLNLKK